jgi:hypothetical protein
MFFHKVNAGELLEHLKKNSTELHALDIVTLCTTMLLLYKKAASIPDFILTMEEAQKKAKRAKLPILDIELAMYATTSMLQSGDYKKETNKWEGRNANKKTWTKWKQAYLAAYARGINRKLAGAADEPFTRAANNIMMAATTDVMDALAGFLAATSYMTALQQLTAANLALTPTVSTLTVTNKKLTETVARFNLPLNLHSGSAGHGGEGAQRNAPRAIWGNYCWTHGYKTAHNSVTCVAAHRLPGHDASATVVDTKGGKDFNKDWYLQENKYF